jgi:hypothetical protein
MNRDLEALLKAYDAFSQSEDPSCGRSTNLALKISWQAALDFPERLWMQPYA